MVVYYPSADGGATVDPAAVPCPVIIFAPGLTLSPRFYLSYAEQLASWGYIVHLAHYKGVNNLNAVADVKTHLDLFLGQNDAPTGLFSGTMDKDRIGVAGHSMGAKYSVMVCMEDDRFKTAVTLEVVDGAAGVMSPKPFAPAISPERMDEVEEPILYMGGEFTSFFSPAGQNFDAFYDESVGPAQKVRIFNADHASFHDYQLGVWVEMLHLLMGGHKTNDLQTRNIAIQYMVAWFKVYLEGDESFRTYLTGDVAQADVVAGLVEISTKGL